MLAEFGGPTGELEASGINPEDEFWPRYAFKLATGAGKTKCMSLAIVWSYFHALREGSAMPRHFVVIAPNLTVFERLKEDFRPEGGGQDIFSRDPLIPTEWKGDWNFSVVLQGEQVDAREWWDPHWIEDRIQAKLREFGGAASGGTAPASPAPAPPPVRRRRR